MGATNPLEIEPIAGGLPRPPRERAVGSDPLHVSGLTPLMDVSTGDPEVVVGLIDGPVAMAHPDLSSGRLVPIGAAACQATDSTACAHGTFTAGILCARRGADAPAIAPGCTVFVRPVFSEEGPAGQLPSASPSELATAIEECVRAGARILNLSAALLGASPGAEREVDAALERAFRSHVLVVAAAGNDGALTASAVTRHPWVLPVAAISSTGVPLAQSNFGPSVARRGLGAPGDRIVSLAPEGRSVTSGGTSIATPFVTGAAALLWSAFPQASVAHIKDALLSSAGRRRTVFPPLLNAWQAYLVLDDGRRRGWL